MKYITLTLSRSFRLFTQYLLLLFSALLFAPFATAVETHENQQPVIKQSLLSINQASAESLATSLNGIGLAKAQAIVEWREQHGEFTSLEQLLEVKGIGEKTLERNRNKLTL